MKEKDFSKEITLSFTKFGILSRKIADTPFSQEMLKCPICKNSYKNPVRGFAHKKPFDRIAIIGNNIFGIEEKVSNSNTFNLKDLRTKHKHQVENLKNAKYGFFLINFKVNKKNISYNVIKILTGKEMNDIINSEQKSIPLLKKDGSIDNSIGRYAIKRKGIWDLSWLINYGK